MPRPGGAGHGLRALNDTPVIKRQGEKWGLVADDLDEEGNPVPLPLRLELLRLTHIELYQRPVAHTEKTASTYMVRNRGNASRRPTVPAAPRISAVSSSAQGGASGSRIASHPLITFRRIGSCRDQS